MFTKKFLHVRQDVFNNITECEIACFVTISIVTPGYFNFIAFYEETVSSTNCNWYLQLSWNGNFKIFDQFQQKGNVSTCSLAPPKSSESEVQTAGDLKPTRIVFWILSKLIKNLEVTNLTSVISAFGAIQSIRRFDIGYCWYTGYWWFSDHWKLDVRWDIWPLWPYFDHHSTM